MSAIILWKEQGKQTQKGDGNRQQRARALSVVNLSVDRARNRDNYRRMEMKAGKRCYGQYCYRQCSHDTGICEPVIILRMKSKAREVKYRREMETDNRG